MSVAYRAVGWNATKRRYDVALGGGLALYLLVFTLATLWRSPAVTAETLVIRALGSAAFGLLHVILSIGPLTRIDTRFLPLLYNRRHLGVTMSVLALGHGTLSLVQFHALGDETLLVSLLTTSMGSSPATFPFQVLGAFALVVLVVMAATSHDFWLRALTPPVWKALHMGVYAAYAALVLHVALGLLQTEHDPVLSGALVMGLLWIAAVHVIAGLVERAGDRSRDGAPRSRADDVFVDVCDVAEIREGRAVVVTLAGERVAIFRYEGMISALSNVCQHQNGPLGEGRIRNGCVVCPWHGYEYLPHSGASPAPFTEKVPTFRVQVRAGRVWVDPEPYPPGTPLEPARIESHPRPVASQSRGPNGEMSQEIEHAVR